MITMRHLVSMAKCQPLRTSNPAPNAILDPDWPSSAPLAACSTHKCLHSNGNCETEGLSQSNAAVAWQRRVHWSLARTGDIMAPTRFAYLAACARLHTQVWAIFDGTRTTASQLAAHAVISVMSLQTGTLRCPCNSCRQLISQRVERIQKQARLVPLTRWPEGWASVSAVMRWHFVWCAPAPVNAAG
ncbi:hypothetical protein L209DRAFT_214074 [Thermothelomyces heterothallicus CBS 203.75]